MFNRLFGGGQNKTVAPVSAKTSENVVGAIQTLAEQGELLEKRKDVLEKKIAAELAKAKQYLQQGNKAAAMSAMKKKALIVKQLEGVDNNIMRLIEQQNALEAAQMQVTTVAAMSHAARAQKATMAEFNVDKVDKIFEEIQEAADQSEEIQQALATPLGGAGAIDEDELAAELAEMEAQQLDAELLQPAPIPTTLPAAAEQLNLPSVPTGAPAVAKKKKTAEDELAELEAEMAAGQTVRNIRHLCQNAAAGDGQEKAEEESVSEQVQPRSQEVRKDNPDSIQLEADTPHGHEHDPLHSAAHQGTHRVSEKVTFSALERLTDSLLGRAAKKVGSRAVEKTAAKTAERIGERAIDRAGEHILDGIITRAAKKAGKAAAQHAAEAGVVKGLEHASEKAGERILEGVLEKATKQAGIAAARHAAESGVTKGLERAAEEMLPRAGKRAMESAFERGAMQAFERGAEKTLPRAGEMGAVVAGERIAEQAARHAATSGGVRRGLETVMDRVLIRIGRGMTIALPALGSLFVLHLVKEDRKRALAEADKGNMPAARAFWLAFLCDASDLAAHVIIVTALLNVHYGVGPHLPHTWLHTAEYGGLAVAVVSTLAAVVGELLSAGVSWPWWDNSDSQNSNGSHPKTE